MNSIFRGIFNRMSQGRSASGGQQDSDDEDVGPRTQAQARRPRPQRRQPKQFNSDWNTVVEETDNTNLFFSIFNAPQQAAEESKNTIVDQNKAKVRRQIMLQRQLPTPTTVAKEEPDVDCDGDSQMQEEKEDMETFNKTADMLKGALETVSGDKGDTEPAAEDAKPTEEDQKDKESSDDEEAPLIEAKGGNWLLTEEDKPEDDDDKAGSDKDIGERLETVPDKEMLETEAAEANGAIAEDKTVDPEESKASINQRLKDQRIFEFVRQTKYSEYYQRLIPNKHLRSIQADDARIYGGRFTTKGNLYYCSSQESINLYDTRDPFNWTLRSKIQAQNISWTVTDMDVTPDEQFMVYSSIDPYVRLVDLDTMKRKQEMIDLSGANDRRQGGYGGRSISIMSLKLSGDGKEILGGTKGAHLLVYDLVANRMVQKVDNCHTDEINSVCFANRQHSNIIFSGSDDGMVKVWDRRALNSNRPAGIFVGHSEGVTNIASKGDGVYLASNGKDQLLKVWDIRQSISYDKFQHMQLPRQDPGFDYRYGSRYSNLNKQPKHFADKSVFTFKGHAVYSTLIRCQFSPLETTGQRYVYTGSSDGNLHIYDLVTGDTAGVLQKKKPARGSDMYGYGNASPARDISWHPYMPVLASTEFNGCVNIWSMQNIGEEERQKMAQKASINKNSESQEVGGESGEDDEEVEEEEEEEDNSMSSLFGSQQYVMVRGANGAAYRIPISMLRRILADEDNKSDEEEAEEESKNAEDSKDVKDGDEDNESSEIVRRAAPKSDSDNDLYDSDEMPGLENSSSKQDEEEKKEEEIPKKEGDKDPEDWDMDDVSWGDHDDNDLEPKMASSAIVKQEESSIDGSQGINQDNQADNQAKEEAGSESAKEHTSEAAQVQQQLDEDQEMTPSDSAVVADANDSSAVFNGMASEEPVATQPNQDAETDIQQ